MFKVKRQKKVNILNKKEGKYTAKFYLPEKNRKQNSN